MDLNGAVIACRYLSIHRLKDKRDNQSLTFSYHLRQQSLQKVNVLCLCLFEVSYSPFHKG